MLEKTTPLIQRLIRGMDEQEVLEAMAEAHGASQDLREASEALGILMTALGKRLDEIRLRGPT